MAEENMDEIETGNGETAVKEISRDEGISSFLTNEKLCDVELEGSDGVKVKANRYFLSCRSPVFESMFLGPFQESNKKVVNLEYPGEVLQAIVEYICTDSPAILKFTKAKGEDITPADISSAENLVVLTSAAKFFLLSELQKKTIACLELALTVLPMLSFPILNACRSEGLAIPAALVKSTLKCLRKKKRTFDSLCVCSLSPGVMKEILQDQKLQMNEFQLFNMLQIWANGTVDAFQNEGSPLNEDNDPKADNSRHALAMELTKFIRFEDINPTELSTVVANSGLVTRDQLFEAFKAQACTALKKHNISFQTDRCKITPYWRLTKTADSNCPRGQEHMTDFVGNYDAMKGGVHCWRLQMSRVSNYIKIGIFAVDSEVSSTKRMDKENGCWAYWNDGDSHVQGTQFNSNFPTFEAGQTVTLTLNLTSDTGGTLKASIDDQDPFLLFADINSYDKATGGFLPAVCHSSENSVKILSIEELFP